MQPMKFGAVIAFTVRGSEGLTRNGASEKAEAVFRLAIKTTKQQGARLLEPKAVESEQYTATVARRLRRSSSGRRGRLMPQKPKGQRWRNSD